MSSTNVLEGRGRTRDAPRVAEKKQRSERFAAMAHAAGCRLLGERKALGWSQRKLQDLSGVDTGTISRIEKGQQVEISTGVFMSLCRSLRLDPMATWFGPRGAASSNPPPESSERPSVRLKAAQRP